MRNILLIPLSFIFMNIATAQAHVSLHRHKPEAHAPAHRHHGGTRHAAYRVRHVQPLLAGTASWYGSRHAGRITSSGERYNPNLLTCAHRTLPLGTIIRVTEEESGRNVLVRVNDRGPYVAHRIVDLSARAATTLGFKDDGLARVKIDVIQTPPVEVAMAPN